MTQAEKHTAERMLEAALNLYCRAAGARPMVDYLCRLTAILADIDAAAEAECREAEQAARQPQ